MLTHTEKQRNYRKGRRERGLCGWKGCEVITGDDSYYCAEHGECHAKRMRKAREKSVAA